MKKIVLVGGGGHCCSVVDTLLDLNIYEEIVITDVSENVEKTMHGCKIVGDDRTLPSLLEQGFEYAFVTIGGGEKPSSRVSYINYVKNLGFKIPNIIDSSAIVSKSAAIEEGVFIGKKAIINAGARIGNHCIINTGAIVEHECEVGDYSHISVGAILCGKVHVGYSSFIGAGATLIHNIKIGNNVIVGANSTVIRSVIDNSTVVGVVK